MWVARASVSLDGPCAAEVDDRAYFSNSVTGKRGKRWHKAGEQTVAGARTLLHG